MSRAAEPEDASDALASEVENPIASNADAAATIALDGPGILINDDEPTNSYVWNTTTDWLFGTETEPLAFTGLPVERKPKYISYWPSGRSPSLDYQLLQEGIDYRITIQDNVYPGMATGIIEGIGAYSGSVEYHFPIVAVDARRVSVSQIPEQESTARQITPPVEVSLNGVLLEEGVSYTLEYGENRFSQGSVTIKGLAQGGLDGTTSIGFDIAPLPLEHTQIDGVQNVVYSALDSSWQYPGSSPNSVGPYQNVQFTVTYDGYTFPKDAYTLEWQNSTGAGEARVVFTGRGGQLTGSEVRTYQVLPCALQSHFVDDVETQLFDGKPSTPKVAVTERAKVGDAGVKLMEGRDYTVAYANNALPGTARVTITGKGNYTGSVVKTFRIVRDHASWKRLAGQTALDTMARIVEAGFSQAGTVVLATNGGYWDALAASSLAGLHNAPVLLTDGRNLSSATRAQINRLGANRVLICGGTAAISTTVERQLRNLGCSTVRYAGANAIGTARSIAQALGNNASDTCIVATSQTYQDALSIAPYSYAFKAPIFLTDGKRLDGQSLTAIAKGFERVIIVGGTMAVSKNIEEQLLNRAPVRIVRLAGANAYGTSAKIAAWERSQGMRADSMAIATCKGYWDALSGAAFCGKNNSVLVLADAYKRDCISGFVRAKKNEIAKGYILGGPAAVSELVLFDAEAETVNKSFPSIEDLPYTVTFPHNSRYHSYSLDEAYRQAGMTVPREIAGSGMPLQGYQGYGLGVYDRSNKHLFSVAVWKSGYKPSFHNPGFASLQLKTPSSLSGTGSTLWLWVDISSGPGDRTVEAKELCKIYAKMVSVL